jgi:uncharacterized protein YjbJ (UPF0337 family)
LLQLNSGTGDPVRGTTKKESDMDVDRIEGAGHEVKGAVKEAAGKVLGDKSAEVKGRVEKNHGTVQREVGESRDEVQDAIDDAKNVDSTNGPTRAP